MVGDDKSVDIFVYVQLCNSSSFRGKGKVGILFLLFQAEVDGFQRHKKKKRLGRYISELGNLSLLGTVTS